MAKVEMKPVKDFPDYYITKTGELYSSKRGSTVKMKPSVFNGYARAKLFARDGSYKNVAIHRLVAEAYLKKPRDKNKNIVNHIDGVKTNNHVSNLEWTDHNGNMGHYKDNLEKGYREQRTKVKQDIAKAKQDIVNYAFTAYTKTQTPDEFMKVYQAVYGL